MSLPIEDNDTAHDALAKAKIDGAANLKAAEDALPNKLKLLTDEEREKVTRVLDKSWKNRDTFSDGELKLLEASGLSALVKGHAAGWAAADKKFEPVAKSVWERNPDKRDAAAVLKLAEKWGRMDSVTRAGLAAAVTRVEKGERFTAAERDAVLEFAGERFFAEK